MGIPLEFFHFCLKWCCPISLFLGCCNEWLDINVFFFRGIWKSVSSSHPSDFHIRGSDMLDTLPYEATLAVDVLDVNDPDWVVGVPILPYLGGGWSLVSELLYPPLLFEIYPHISLVYLIYISQNMKKDWHNFFDGFNLKNWDAHPSLDPCTKLMAHTRRTHLHSHFGCETSLRKHV